MLPTLSVRYSTRPPLNSVTARATSMVTVPVFGLGMRPRGPSTRPSEPTWPMRSGVAIATSKSKKPSPWIRATRSSAPTTSAPALRASAACSPAAKTATRTLRPDPDGNDRVPRTIWSALRGSTPKRTASSTVSSNLARASSFTRVIASLTPWSSSRFTWPATSVYFFPCWVMSALPISADDADAHRAGGAGHLLLGRLEVVSVQVLKLHLGDVDQLGVGDGRHLVPARGRRPLGDTGRLAQEHRGGRSLEH